MEKVEKLQKKTGSGVGAFRKSILQRPRLVEKSKPELKSKEELRQVAIQALVEVAEDPEAPAAARAAASRTLLESLGDIGRLQEVARASEKPLTEMTAKEIDEELVRLKPKS